MVIVTKALSNNSVIATDTKSMEVFVLVGNGIGFGKKVNDSVTITSSVSKFVLVKETNRGKSEDILKYIDPKMIEVSGLILNNAAREFEEIDTSVILALADHLSCALDRLRNNISLDNPFNGDLKLIYPKEYEAASIVTKLMRDNFDIEIPPEEIGYVCLHIHSALDNGHIDQSMKAVVILSDLVNLIECDTLVKIDTSSMAYARLAIHLRYLLARIKKEEILNIDMNDYVLTNHPYAFEIGKKFCNRIAIALCKPVAPVEIGYLAIHIERIRQFVI